MKTLHQDGHPPFPLHGKPTIQNRTEMFPTGDELIAAARNALWEAWQIGLQKGGNTVYPKVPLLDREPMEPEI